MTKLDKSNANKVTLDLIAVEGVDEVGKSTAIKYLSNKLETLNPLVTNVWGHAGIMGREAYKLISTGVCSPELIYHMAVAGRLLALPKLKEHNGIILADRWSASTFAYNGYFDVTSQEPISWLYLSSDKHHTGDDREVSGMDEYSRQSERRTQLLARYNQYFKNRTNVTHIKNNNTLDEFYAQLDAYAEYINDTFNKL